MKPCIMPMYGGVISENFSANLPPDVLKAWRGYIADNKLDSDREISELLMEFLKKQRRLDANR